MSQILRQYIDENGLQITEFTRDGVTVSATIKQTIPVDLPEPIPIEPQPTLEEKLARMEQQLQEQALIQLEVLATIYEELLMKG